MKNLRVLLNKPEYFFQPRQFLKRLKRGASFVSKSRPEILLPFGLPLTINPNETIGHSLWHLGIYDLAMSETLWRLLDTEETAWDVGANIGYVTGLMAKRVGQSGRVVAFEPHPDLFSHLETHVRHWERQYPIGKVTLFQAAVADVGPDANKGIQTRFKLVIPSEFSKNSGLSYIADETSDAESTFKNSATKNRNKEQTIDVSVLSLQQTLLKTEHSPQVLKIDTEGTELSVLKSGGDLISPNGIRDILFEDHGIFPTPTQQYLLERGYRVFAIQKNFTGPSLVEPPRPTRKSKWEPPNYLATLNSERALSRLRSKGWKVLKG